MIPSVSEILQDAAELLGDPTARKFTPAKLQNAFAKAYEELTGEMARYFLRKQKRAVNYPLPANTTSLSPATAGISNMGEIIKLEERAYGSDDLYTLVHPRITLPQRVPSIKLYDYEWSDDTMHFVGATNIIDLIITYYDSGVAPTSGSVGIDGSRNFLAHRTAAIAGRPAGNVELAKLLDIDARGPRQDGSGGFMHTLIGAMLTADQKTQLQVPYYKAGGSITIGGAFGLTVADGGGGSVGAPTEVTPTGTIDGANDTFTLSAAPLFMSLYLNGVLLQDGVAYTRTGLTIVMAPAYIPQTSDRLRAQVW